MQFIVFACFFVEKKWEILVNIDFCVNKNFSIFDGYNIKKKNNVQTDRYTNDEALLRDEESES